MKLKDINLLQVYRNWKENSKSFEAFIRSGPFVSLKTYDNFELDLSFDIYCLEKKHRGIVNDILNCDKDEFIICDFNFDDAVEIGFLLNNLYSVKPIISFNLLFHPFGLIGNEKNIENLIKFGLNLTKTHPIKHVLFYNYERYRDVKESEYKKKLNNQYEVCEDDLPYAETLRNLSYSKVTLYTKEPIKDDIKGYLEYIKKDNIKVNIKMS